VTEFFPLTPGTRMQKTNTDLEPSERSLTGNSSKDSRYGSSDGALQCSEALQRATGQNLSAWGTGATPQGVHTRMSPDKNDTGNLEVLAKRMATWIYGRGKK
jgi:hypothetical protein